MAVHRRFIVISICTDSVVYSPPMSLSRRSRLSTHPIDHSPRWFPFVFVHVGDLVHLNFTWVKMDASILDDIDDAKKAAIDEISAKKSEFERQFASGLQKLDKVMQEFSSSSQKLMDSALSAASNCTQLVYVSEQRMAAHQETAATTQPSTVEQFLNFKSMMLFGCFCLLLIFLVIYGRQEVQVLKKRIEVLESGISESRVKQTMLELKIADSVQKLAVMSSLFYDLRENQVVRDSKMSDLAEKLLAFDSLFWDVKEKQHVGDSIISQVGKKLEFGD